MNSSLAQLGIINEIFYMYRVITGEIFVHDILKSLI